MIKNIIIILLPLLIITGNAFGQIDRQNAKFMDTCYVEIVYSDTISKTNLDSNAFINSNCQLKKYNLIVLNKWGTIVYNSNDIEELIPFHKYKEGLYAWLLDIRYPNGKRYKKKGIIILKE